MDNNNFKETNNKKPWYMRARSFSPPKEEDKDVLNIEKINANFIPACHISTVNEYDKFNDKSMQNPTNTKIKLDKTIYNLKEQDLD